MKCPACRGAGKFIAINLLSVSAECNKCGGLGEIPTNKYTVVDDYHTVYVNPQTEAERNYTLITPITIELTNEEYKKFKNAEIEYDNQQDFIRNKMKEL